MSNIIKKRSTDGLLKAAKRLSKHNHNNFKNTMKISSRNDTASASRYFHIVETSTQQQVKIVENKRLHKVPGYVNLPPTEFMAWYITSTGAKRKSSNILLKYLKYKYGENIPA